MEITICIGSSCHLKGSRDIVSELETLIAAQGLTEQIKLKGAFCMGKCSHEGVSVKIDGELIYVKPEKVEEFFQTEILGRLEK